VSTLLWIGFWLCIGAIAFGLAWCALSGLRLWRAFRHGLGDLMRSAETLLMEGERLAQRGERLAGTSTQLLDAVSRLQRSLARARVLLAAWNDVASLWALVRSFVPAK